MQGHAEDGKLEEVSVPRSMRLSNGAKPVKGCRGVGVTPDINEI